jgi:hypothetical protein
MGLRVKITDSEDEVALPRSLAAAAALHGEVEVVVRDGMVELRRPGWTPREGWDRAFAGPQSEDETRLDWD